MPVELSRRQMIARSGSVVAAGTLAAVGAQAPAAETGTKPPDKPFRYSLNTGTIMGYKLPVDQEVEVAAKAGYDGIEPWIHNVQRYAEGGRSLSDLRKKIADRGLAVEGAIGFPCWAVDDDAQRAEGLEQMKRDMDLIAQIGGTRIAASPAGINRTPGVDLRKVGRRYRAVLDLGREMGVVPQLEIWGTAQTLGTVADAAFVAVAAKHADACLLLDAYHVFRGGSGFDCLKLLHGGAMHVFHVNDYPADPPREKMSDADRIYPGDGVAPTTQILRDLRATGFRGALSLELFNRDYWQQDVDVVARTGLEKTRAAVAKALA